MNKKATRPIRKKGEVQQSNDEHIDQDFPGFPHPPAGKEAIAHNGSANAFKGTEYDGDDGPPEEEENGKEKGKDKY